jgi:hypothetical protein
MQLHLQLIVLPPAVPWSCLPPPRLEVDHLQHRSERHLLPQRLHLMAMHESEIATGLNCTVSSDISMGVGDVRSVLSSSALSDTVVLFSPLINKSLATMLVVHGIGSGPGGGGG